MQHRIQDKTMYNISRFGIQMSVVGAKDVHVKYKVFGLESFILDDGFV